MRELLLMVIVAPLCLLSVVSPRIGVLVYVWFAAARPDIAAYSTKPFFFVIAICVAIGSLRVVHQYSNVVRNWITAMVLLMQIPIALSIVFAVRQDLCWANYDIYVKVVVMSLLIPIIVVDEEMMRLFLLILPLSLGFIAAKFAVWGLLLGGHIPEIGYGGMLADSNGLALAMAMLVPLAWFAKDLTTNWMVKWALLGITGMAAANVMMTGSRGNSLALGVVVLLLVLRSKRKTLALIVMACLLVPVFTMLGSRYMDRMATLRDVRAESSADSRLVFAMAALHMWQDHPTFGVGFGQENYTALNYLYIGDAATKGLVVHNTYLQTLVDSGIITFVMFVGTLWGTVWWVGRSARKIKAVRPDLVSYARSLQLSLLAYAIGCTFYSRPQFEIFYIVLGGAASWQLVVRKVLSTPALAPEPVKPPMMALQAEARR